MNWRPLTKAPIGFLVQHFDGKAAADSFAETNALLTHAVINQPAVIAHFWTTSPTVILGMQDMHLPALDAGVKVIHEADHGVFVRNSGGLAVVSDPLVLNFSLFLPPLEELTIPAAYGLMAEVIQTAFAKTPVTVGTVPTSYCPGSYDLSIAGKKFAGLAQRRTSKGIVVMAYISVAGDQAKRGELMHRFYGKGQANEADYDYPQVDPESMGTLKELTGKNWSPLTVRMRLMNTLKQFGATVDLLTVVTQIHSNAFEAALKEARADIIERNRPIH